MELSIQCPAVIVCRCSPTQKADIVRLIKVLFSSKYVFSSLPVWGGNKRTYKSISWSHFRLYVISVRPWYFWNLHHNLAPSAKKYFSLFCWELNLCFDWLKMAKTDLKSTFLACFDLIILSGNIFIFLAFGFQAFLSFKFFSGFNFAVLCRFFQCNF